MIVVIHTATLVHGIPTILTEYIVRMVPERHIERDKFHRPWVDGRNLGVVDAENKEERSCVRLFYACIARSLISYARTAQVRSHCTVRTHSIHAHKIAPVMTHENGHNRYGHSKYGHTDTYGRSTYHASNLLSSLGSAAMWSQCAQ
jgi:hypothetical protein